MYITGGVHMCYKRIGITIMYIIILFFLVRFMNFSFFSDENILQEIYAWISRGFFCLVFFFYILNFDFKLSVPMVFCLILGGEIFFSNIVYSSDISRFLSLIYPIIGTVCFIELAIRIYNKQEELIHALSMMMFVLICVNFIDLIMNKDVSIYSLYAVKNYLIAGKNQIGVPLIIGLTFIEIWAMNTKNGFIKVIEWIYIVISIITVIFAMSGTGIVSFFTIVVLLKINIIKKVMLKIHPWIVIISYIGFWILFVIVRIQNLFSYIIEVVLHKNLTLTHRTDIWDIALEKIGDNLILGHGMAESGNYFTIISFQNGNGIVSTLSAHDFILQLLYESGILAAVILFAFMLVSTRKRERNDVFYTFFMALMGILITCLTEAISIYNIIFILTFCYYSKKFNCESDKKV